jgi:hypothetical protein
MSSLCLKNILMFRRRFILRISEISLDLPPRLDYIHPVPSLQRGARERHGRGTECGGRRWHDRRTCSLAYGEVAWSRHPDAGVKQVEAIPPAMVAKEPGRQGDREVSRKAIAWGRWANLVYPVSCTLVRFFSRARLRVRQAPKRTPRPLIFQKAGFRWQNSSTCCETAKPCLFAL